MDKNYPDWLKSFLLKIVYIIIDIFNFFFFLLVVSWVGQIGHFSLTLGRQL